MKRIKDMRGVVHPVPLILAVVVIAAIGFAGMRVMKKDTTKNSSGSTSSKAKIVVDSEAEKSCNKALNDKNLCKMASRMNFSQPYTSSITTSGKDGTSVTKMESSGDDSSMITTQNGKEIAGFISLKGTTYSKDEAAGVWIKFPASDKTKPETSNPADDVKFNTNDWTNGGKETYKSLGKESCGKLTCFKYQIVDSSQPSAQQFIWFDDKDYQMQRFMSKDGAETMDMIFIYQSVNIKAPTPVKDYSTESSADLNAAIKAAQDAAAAAGIDASSTDTTE